MTSNPIADALVQDLGGDDLDEVHIHRDARFQNDLIILGDSLRLICTPNEKRDALIVKAVQTPYIPSLDSERRRSLSCRAMWIAVNSGFRIREDNSSLSRAADELADLLAELDTYESVGAVSQERRGSRREFIEHWNTALKKRRKQFEREGLAYSRVRQDLDYLWFTLTKPPPDNLDWQDDAPLAAKETRESRSHQIGNLIEIRGRVVQVAKVSRQIHGDRPNCPLGGATRDQYHRSLFCHHAPGRCGEGISQ